MESVTQIIINNIADIYDKCCACYRILDELQFNHTQNKNRLDLALNRLQNCIQQMSVHMNLADLRPVDIDFYSEICSYFKNKKELEFYIQDGYDGELIKIPNSSDLSSLFVVKNCLPIMKLVPMQLVNNAIKYKPKETALRIELTYTKERNHIKFINWGPHCDNNEISTLTNKGVRGCHTYDVAGMGIGLSEVKDILSIHKNWLNTTFNLDSNDNILVINSIPYSEFIVEISYSAENTIREYREFSNELERKVPIILMHNYQEILSILLEVCKDICNISERNNNLWKSSLYQLRTNISLSQNTVKACLFFYNNKSVDNLLGNSCRINLTKTFTTTISNIQKYYYPNTEYDIQGKLCEKELKSSIYSCICGIVLFIFDSTPQNLELEVTYETDQVFFDCEKFKFKYKIDENSQDENIEILKLQMYHSLIEALDGSIIISENRVIINF